MRRPDSSSTSREQCKCLIQGGIIGNEHICSAGNAAARIHNLWQQQVHSHAQVLRKNHSTAAAPDARARSAWTGHACQHHSRLLAHAQQAVHTRLAKIPTGAHTHLATKPAQLAHGMVRQAQHSAQGLCAAAATPCMHAHSRKQQQLGAAAHVLHMCPKLPLTALSAHKHWCTLPQPPHTNGACHRNT
jgi:hypothetical protein